MPTRIDITSTYYECFLVISVSIRVGRHQLRMETPRGRNQSPILRYRDVTFTSEYLKDSLSAVCSVLGVHNVARVRQGQTVLFEVDFSEEKALEKFCKSLSNGVLIEITEHLTLKAQEHYTSDRILNAKCHFLHLYHKNVCSSLVLFDYKICHFYIGQHPKYVKFTSNLKQIRTLQCLR